MANRSSPLAQQAQLTTVERMINLGSNVVWGLRNGPAILAHRAMGYAAGYFARKAQEAVVHHTLALAVSPNFNTPLHALRNSLQTIRTSDASADLKKEAGLELQKLARNSTHLNGAEIKQLETLALALMLNSIGIQELLGQACEIIEKLCRLEQQDLRQRAIEAEKRQAPTLPEAVLRLADKTIGHLNKKPEPAAQPPVKGTDRFRQAGADVAAGFMEKGKELLTSALFPPEPDLRLKQIRDDLEKFIARGEIEDAARLLKEAAALVPPDEKVALELADINKGFEIVDRRWQLQQPGILGKMGQQAQHLFGKPQPPNAAALEYARKAQEISDRLYETIPSAPPKQAPSTDPITDIKREFENLKSNAFKMVLGRLILSEISRLLKLIEDSRQSNEKFIEFLWEELESPRIHFIKRAWKQLCLQILAPVLTFYIDHLLDRFRDDILTLIEAPARKRLDLIDTLVVMPARGFLNFLEQEFTNIAASNTVMSDPLTLLAQKIANMKIDHKTPPKILINRFVSLMINQYAPSINWADASSAHFAKHADKTSSVRLRIWFRGWSKIAGFVSFLASPWRWGIDKAIRKIIKAAASYQLHSLLFAKQSTALGNLCTQSLYKSLLKKLEELKLNRTHVIEGGNPPVEKAILMELGDIPSNMRNLLITLFNFLHLHKNGGDLLELREALKSHPLVVAGSKIVLGPASTQAVEQIIGGLQLFLQQESLAPVIRDFLSDLNRESTQVHTVATKEDLGGKFNTELELALKSAIPALLEKLDPKKRTQAEVNDFFVDLKSMAHKFKTGVNKNLNSQQLQQSQKDLLVNPFALRQDRIKKQLNGNLETLNELQNYSLAFIDQRKKIHEQIESIAADVKEKESFIHLQNDLVSLENLLNTVKNASEAEYTLLHQALLKQGHQTYPPPVEAELKQLIEDLDRFRGTDKTKNLSRLSNDIIALFDQLKLAKKQHEEALGKLTQNIAYQLQELGVESDRLAAWSAELKPFECTVPQSMINDFQKYAALWVRGPAEDTLIPAIISSLDEFFRFLGKGGKNENIKGLLWYMLDAYVKQAPNT